MIFNYITNEAGFAGNHSYVWLFQQFLNSRIAVAPAAGVGNLLLIHPPTLDGGYSL